MKKICYFIFPIILSLMLISCDLDSDVKPRNQDNTKWVSENPKIYFIVTKDEPTGCNSCMGKLNVSEKSYNIDMDFDYGRGVNILDYDIMEKNNFIYRMEAILIRADCKFSEKKCTIKVTESSIDGIEVDDKITFKKVDELPDWATEAVEATVES